MNTVITNIVKYITYMCAVLVLANMVVTPVFAYTLDYGGSDYGYSYSSPTYDYGGSDYGYGYDSYTYDYGGSDYGYNYDTYTYDYGGSDYGYNYNPIDYDYGGSDYGYTYNPTSYDYGGSDYGYNYNPTDYDYGGSDYGYTYTPVVTDYGGSDYGYTYNPTSYDYGGSDYGYTSPETPFEEVPFDQPFTVISDVADYDFLTGYPDYGGYTSYSYSTPYMYSYAPVSYGYNNYSYNSPTYTYNPPTSHDRPVCTLNISPNVIEKGENATIRWNTDNARTVTISDGIGSVDDDGSRTISPNSSRTYVLVASGPGGTVTCSDSITVEKDRDDNDRDVRCDAFTVSDREVKKGDKVTLEWRTTGANDVDINQGVGDVEDDGSERVTINRDTTFKLTARNGSETDTCTVDVEIEDKDNDKNPRCELKISDRNVKKNDSVRLSWDNDRTDRIVLKDNHGKEIADSRDDRNVDDDKDSVSVRVTRDTKYTLTAYNGSEKDTCSVEVEIGDKKKDVVVTSVRSQDTITLSQVPYTGFEAGPVLTFIFYAAIVMWGVVVGYILVLKAKAGAVVATGAALAPAAMVASTQASKAPVVEIPFNLPAVQTAQEIVEEPEFEETDLHDSIKSLEQHAHESYTLLSSDALRFIASQADSYDEQVATLDHVILLAKARFPKEGDWIVLNKERVISLLS